MGYNNRKPNFGKNDNFNFQGRGGNRGYRGGRSRRPRSVGIDTNLYTKSIDKTQATQNKDDHKGTFLDLNLDSNLQKIIDQRGFSKPTKIQHQIIPEITSGKDIVGISQTGSGKTGAFLIPLLNKVLQNKNRNSQTLILTPTRELAFQVDKELFEFGLRKFDLYSLVLVGGMDIRPQIQRAKKQNQFIIATPGRLIDLIKRNVLKLDAVDTLVIDEIDRMLDMGFIDDINWIISQLPKQRQNLYFSATLDKKTKPVLDKLAPEIPVIKIGNPTPSEFVEQRMVRIPKHENKTDHLVEILKNEAEKTIVFVNTKIEVERVSMHLTKSGFDVEFIHGDRSQRQRTNAIKYYKKKTGGVLVATNVAARGIDIDDISHVINYDEPENLDEYIHRIGRTGRAGKFGIAITLVQR